MILLANLIPSFVKSLLTEIKKGAVTARVFNSTPNAQTQKYVLKIRNFYAYKVYALTKCKSELRLLDNLAKK